MPVRLDGQFEATAARDFGDESAHKAREFGILPRSHDAGRHAVFASQVDARFPGQRRVDVEGGKGPVAVGFHRRHQGRRPPRVEEGTPAVVEIDHRALAPGPRLLREVLPHGVAAVAQNV